MYSDGDRYHECMTTGRVSKRRGPYAAGVARRDAILQAAKQKFAEDGFAKSSISDIARAAGVTDTGLKHHFGSKDQLLLDVLASAEQDSAHIAADLLNGSASTTRLWEILVALADHNSQVPGLVHLSVVVSAESTTRNHPAHSWMQHRMAELSAATAAILQRGIADGLINPATDCPAIARETIAVLDGLQLQWILSDGSFDMTAAVRTYVDRLARSLAV